MWTVYTRESCSLCESFVAELADLMGARAAQVQLIDVETDSALQTRYGSKVPVLVIDGDIVCMYRIDPQRVRAHL